MPAGGPPSAPGAVVINLNRNSLKNAYSASGCLLLIGLMCLSAPLITGGHLDTRIEVFGVWVFVVPLLISLALRRRLARPRLLTIDSRGMRWDFGWRPDVSTVEWR